MALRSSVVRKLTCQSCRQSILQSFISSIGGPVLPRATPLILPRRDFTSSITWHNSRVTHIQTRDEDFLLNIISDETDAQSDPELRADRNPEPPSGLTAGPDSKHDAEHNTRLDPPSIPSPPDPHLPWYLQQTLTPPPPTPSASQSLPDLPLSPPPVLSPLLTHLSLSLGLDDLTLLDLRSLDPPSALGPNLLMLIGSARSEKHLHVSADRLCRWLRSEHGLSPYADGLLGRNELKLMMKRKAKRSRLLSAVGAKGTGRGAELEEGVRTGWVCVNVGRVGEAEGGEGEGVVEEQQQRKGEVVGFGTGSRKVSLVVQLMTEEKRGELELEKLWGTTLKRSVAEAGRFAESEEKGEAAHG